MEVVHEPVMEYDGTCTGNVSLLAYRIILFADALAWSLIACATNSY